MPLAPGTRLGAYEVTAQIGAGGMGQVFRATDTKLKRQVAIKILPPSLATDPERLARFQREAEVLASLNHPHIAGIYGLEEGGGTTALVMELVDGEDLSQRIARGSIPIEEALPIAKQITEALEAAHEQGIIHRDLKPANIKVRPDGTVKVLDFGLAKAMDPAGAASADAMDSPTLSIHGTQAGVILGTAAYMSPEQARGRPVDKRTDVWAFGCVLFEMLSGRRPLDTGHSVPEAIAAILKVEPDWTQLPLDTPGRVRDLLTRCLRKEADRRLHDIADARLDIEDALSAPSPLPSAPSAAHRWRPYDFALAGLVGIGIGAALALVPWRGQRPPARAPSAIRFIVETPQLMSTFSVGVSSIALAPDGTLLAYATEGGPLYVRRLDELVARPIPGTVGAIGPFFSPDGQSVAFSAGGKLQKARVTGSPQVICDVKSFLGGTWGRRRNHRLRAG